MLSRNITRNFLNADYLLSANPYMTEHDVPQRLPHAGHLPGRGHRGGPPPHRPAGPRHWPIRVAVRRRLEAGGVPVGDRKIVLYAPTWRGDDVPRPARQRRPADRRTVRASCSARWTARRYVVLLKVHQVGLPRRARAGRRLRRSWCPTTSPPTWSSGVTDVLVTDYSSIFFDYLSTGRPVRALRPGPRRLPHGPRPLPHREAAARPGVGHGPRAGRGPRARPWSGPDGPPAPRPARRRYAPRDDGAVCARVVDLVFRGADESGVRGASRLRHREGAAAHLPRRA